MPKCRFCGGSIVYRPGNSSQPAEYRCIHCGRNPEQGERKTGQELFGKKSAAHRNYPGPDSEIEI